MEERKQKNSRNIFYAIVGIATLIVSVMGATFAYFTATAANNSLKGNMATISFDIDVKKVTNVDNSVGMIPMSNNMMQMAVSNASGKGICKDNNGNAVCQIYKITVVNDSTASMFLDGYVTLTGGSGVPTDIVGDNPATTGTNESAWTYSEKGTETTMRWAQVFCNTESGNLVTTSCTTTGKSTARTDTAITLPALGGTNVKGDGKNTGEIKRALADVSSESEIKGNPYRVINKNYIRISDKKSTETTYDRTKDITSALVYSQYIEPKDASTANNTGTSSSTFTDAQVYYIVVWLSETGTNQTASTDAELIAYFRGRVTFISSQGSEVTATFADHARVPSDTQ